MPIILGQNITIYGTILGQYIAKSLGDFNILVQYMGSYIGSIYWVNILGQYIAIYGTIYWVTNFGLLMVFAGRSRNPILTDGRNSAFSLAPGFMTIGTITLRFIDWLCHYGPG